MDIKPDNVLQDDTVIKISGYGIYQNYHMDAINCCKERLIFMSPEYRSAITITSEFDYGKSDMFSVGLPMV